MVWFYYISNIWKNQVFLKNRSPDFLLSPFFAQCECTVHSDAGNRRGKGKESGRAGKPPQSLRLAQCQLPQGERLSCRPLWGMGTTPAGQDPFAEMLFKALFCPGSFPARTRARYSFILSFLFLSFFISVQVLCICCAFVVHEGGKKRRCAQCFRVFPVVQVLCSFGRSLCTVHCALCTKKSVAPPRRTGRAFTKEKDSPLEEII